MPEVKLLLLHVVTSLNISQPSIDLRQANYNHRKILGSYTADMQYLAVICTQITFLVT